MAVISFSTYHCDDCGKQIQRNERNVDIVTAKDSDSTSGRRQLHVTVVTYTVHDDDHIKINPADLCQECAVKLLDDALQRLKAGEINTLLRINKK